jgi:hypothetical protein
VARIDCPERAFLALSVTCQGDHPMQSPPSPKDRSSRGSPPRAALIQGLERVASEINPFLVILAIGIAILDLTCYAGLAGTRHLPVRLPATQAIAAPSPAEIPQ